MQLRGKDRAEIKKADAVQYAYRLLSYRDRSEKELRERLIRKNFSEKAIREAISFLKEKGFINDTLLAASLRRTAEDVRLLGTHGARLFLKRRGLPEEIIRNTFADGDADETARAERFVETKLRAMKNYPVETIKRRLWGGLIRRGYSFDTVRKVLKRFNMEVEEQ